jgi:negative regulator of flagellin synthesis FlgM
MDIGPLTGTSEVHKVDTAQARARASAHAAPSAAPAPGDSVDLTDGARQLQDLQAAIAGTPVVDSSRVEALRDAIASGSYTVDPQRVADGLLAQDRAALG